MNLVQNAGYVYVYAKKMVHIKEEIKELTKEGQKNLHQYHQTQDPKKKAKLHQRHLKLTEKVHKLQKEHHLYLQRLRQHHALFVNILRREHEMK